MDTSGSDILWVVGTDFRLIYFFWYLMSRLSSYGQYVIMLSTMFVTLVKVCMSTRKAASFPEPPHSLLGMRLL